MLVTPYFPVALSARADTKPYAMFSRHASISKPALSIAARYWSRCIAPPMQAAPERGVARDALWQLLRGHDVCECEPAAGPQRHGGGGEDGRLVG